MKQVTEKEFFKAIGQINVQLGCNDGYDKVRGIRCDYKTREGKLVGFTDGIEHLENERYFLD